jgi:hypothetical protein
MASPFGKDSISSSANYYNNPYREDLGARRGYDTLQARKNNPEVILSHQDRLESHLLAQFRQNQFKLPKGSFIVVAKVGKWVVLAFALPPYIFFYGAPKWLLEQMKEPVLKLLDASGDLFIKSFYGISAWTKDLFSLAKGTAQKLFKSKPPKKKSAREGDTLFQILGKDIAKKWKSWVENLSILKNFQEKIASSISQAAQKVYIRIADWTAETRLFGVKIQSRLLERLKLPSDALKQGLKALSLRLKSGLKWAEELVSKIPNPLKALPSISFMPIFALFSQRVQQTIEASEKLLNRSIESIKLVAGTILAWAAVRVEAAARLIQVPIAALTNQVKAVANTLFRKWQEAQKIGVGALKQGTKALMRLLNPIKKQLLKILDESKQQGKKQFAQFKKGLVQLVKKTADRIKLGALYSYSALKKAPSAFYRIIVHLLKAAFHLIKKVLWSLRVVMTWIKILVQYSFQNYTQVNTKR